jgi:hypothetical protein
MNSKTAITSRAPSPRERDRFLAGTTPLIAASRSTGLKIANQDPDVALCNQTALDGALMLDRMEDEDARRQSG